MAGRLFIGTAGWSIPKASAERCPSAGTHLERYARIFPAVEINSSFSRSHSAATYLKWADATPDAFRFAVKIPRHITHELRLRRSRLPFARFISDTDGLGGRRGPLLVQLPPSFAFDGRVAERFFRMVRESYSGALVCEPRHPTWFSAAAQDLFNRHAIARVAADPDITGGARLPGGWDGLAYFRLHGSPRTYWSRYGAHELSQLAALVRRLSDAGDVWCIFDNTASGAAIENAWELRQLLS
jgi:uncharacterized protein YecE (DUF72 family)